MPMLVLLLCYCRVFVPLQCLMTCNCSLSVVFPAYYAYVSAAAVLLQSVRAVAVSYDLQL